MLSSKKSSATLLGPRQASIETKCIFPITFLGVVPSGQKSLIPHANSVDVKFRK